MRNSIILTVMAVLLIVVFWVGGHPPSDEVVIAIYTEHHDSLAQLVQLYREDQVGMIVHKNGSIFPAEAADQLPAARVDLYRAMVRDSGVTRSLWNKTEGAATFQIFNPIPLTPMKTLVYSPIQPSLITLGVTDDYVFEVDQYRHVCRPIEPDWYLCLDYED